MYELELLLACTAPDITPVQAAHINALCSQIDADALYALAAQHDLTGLLYRGLLQAGAAELAAPLADEILELGFYYDFMYPQDQALLLAALADAGIEALVLKGHAIAHGVYGERPLRPYTDIDLLVRPAHITAAADILTSLGYTPDESEHDRHWYTANHHHIVPYVRAGTLPVEIHRALVSDACAVSIDADALWARAVPLDVGGYSGRMLADTHLLLHLCIHMTCTHVFEMGLKPLCDVRELITCRPPDWADVQATAQAWGCERHVGLVLALVSRLFDLPQPAELPRPEPRFLDYVLANTLATAVAGLPDSSGLAAAWQEQGTVARLRGMLRRLFPPRAEVATAFQLPASNTRTWLYYPRWQARLVRRHAGNAWHLLRGDHALQAQARTELTRRALLDWLRDTN